jgi:hypothetical protein
MSPFVAIGTRVNTKAITEILAASDTLTGTWPHSLGTPESIAEIMTVRRTAEGHFSEKEFKELFSIRIPICFPLLPLSYPLLEILQADLFSNTAVYSRLLLEVS